MKPNAAMAAVPLQAPAGAVVSSHDTPANETGKDNVAGHSAPLTLEQRVALSIGYIQALSALWPDLVALTDDQRRASNGRLASRYVGALETLFTVASTPPYAPAFALLGNTEGKVDGGTFDPAALLDEIQGIAALRKVSIAVKKLDALIDDDLMHRGEKVVEPGLAALDLARSLARSNAHFRAKIATSLNEFKSMTARARRPKSPSDEIVDDGAEGDTPDADE